MNLYLVTCIYLSPTSYDDTYNIYVVAPDMVLAGETALKTIKNLEYKYDKVQTVKLIASVNTYNAEHLLAVYTNYPVG